MSNQNNQNDDYDQDDQPEFTSFNLDPDLVKSMMIISKLPPNDPRVKDCMYKVYKAFGETIPMSEILNLMKELSQKMAADVAKILHVVKDTCGECLKVMSLMGEDVATITIPLEPSIVIWFKDGIKSDRLYRNLTPYMKGDVSKRYRANIKVEVYPGNGPEEFARILGAIFRSN